MIFFSSRRRHTRCLSDWSSDVCSSDLGTPYPHLLWPDNTMEIVEAGTELASNEETEGVGRATNKVVVNLGRTRRYKISTPKGTITSMDGETWYDSKGRKL